MKRRWIPILPGFWVADLLSDYRKHNENNFFFFKKHTHTHNNNNFFGERKGTIEIMQRKKYISVLEKESPCNNCIFS